jgi:hypothetical protein
MDTPDALVLGGGGTLGEAWMWAVLAGAEQDNGFDARGCGAYVGTSAGSIVAALLAAGVAPQERLEREGAGEAITGAPAESERALAVLLGTAGELALAAIAPLAPLALASADRPRQLLARTVLRAVPAGRRSLRRLGPAIERAGASFDGACASSRSSSPAAGGSPSAPPTRPSWRSGWPSKRRARSRVSFARSRPRAAHTSTAACGARRTSTRRRCGAAGGSCA